MLSFLFQQYQKSMFVIFFIHSEILIFIFFSLSLLVPLSLSMSCFLASEQTRSGDSRQEI